MTLNRSLLGNTNSIRYFRLIGILSINLLMIASLILPAHGQSAFIILSPDKGISAITIEGLGFKDNSAITIYWDGEPIPTLPLQVLTDETGSFTCIISVYNQTGMGNHQVNAMDSVEDVAVATFTVIDLEGPQGEQGIPGSSAESIAPGYLAGWLLLAAAIGGLVGVILGSHRRDNGEAKAEATSHDA